MVGEKYHLYKCISKGGVSSTYLAIDQLTSDMHIVKVVESNSSNADIIGGLEKTFNLQSCLSHPAIPKAEALIRAGNFTCFVFEDLQGQTLDVVRKEHGTIDFYTLTDWAVQLCDVLQYLHSQNPQCLLRGLCPSNILLQPDGRLRLIDFPGMLTALNGRVDLQQLGFTAPERFAGNDDVRADIFSLGMVLHNLATGVDTAQPPYIAGPIREHRPDVPHWFEKIVEKCIEADPKNRFQNCDEMVLCLSKHHPTEAD